LTNLTGLQEEGWGECGGGSSIFCGCERILSPVHIRIGFLGVFRTVDYPDAFAQARRLLERERNQYTPEQTGRPVTRRWLPSGSCGRGLANRRSGVEAGDASLRVRSAHLGTGGGRAKSDASRWLAKSGRLRLGRIDQISSTWKGRRGDHADSCSARRTGDIIHHAKHNM
jgi:hypothetical protein